MKQDDYEDLDLGALFEMLLQSTDELLQALESNEDNGIATKVKKKQVEMLVSAIYKKIGISRLVN